MLIYLPFLFFIYLALTTNLIYIDFKPSYWGYTITKGVLYTPFSILIMSYIIAGLFFLYQVYKTTESKIEKKQISYMIIGITIPLIGGFITEIFSPIIG